MVLTNLYPPHHYGGYELLCRDVVNFWRRSGHEVQVACSDHVAPHGLDVIDDPSVARTLKFYWRDHEILRPPPLTRWRMERANHGAWKRLLDRFRPDVVSVWNYGLFSYTLLSEVVDRAIPLVLVIGDRWPVWGPDFDPWTSMFVTGGLHRRLAGTIVGRVTGIATSYPDLGAHAVALPASDWLRDHLERGHWFRFRDIHVVRHGFDASDFPISDPVSRPFGWRLMIPGRLDHRKGWRTAVRALLLLPEATLDLVGAGDVAEARALAQLTNELGVGDRVRAEHCPRDQMAARYRDADVVLFASEWEEPFGIVGLEAMACGVPVVATGTGGSGEYLRHEENCLLFSPGDAEALAASVRRLAGDPGLRRRLQAGGHKTATGLTTSRTARELERWHVRAAGSAGDRSGH